MAEKNNEGDSLKTYSACQLSEIYGHEKNKKAFTEIVAKKSLPLGFLLFGPSGIGKTTFGRVIAKSILCECGPTLEPCEKCDPCKRISSGMGDFSYFEIDAAKFRSRDKIKIFFQDHNGNPPYNRNKRVFLFKNFGRIKRDDQEIVLKEVQKKKDFTYFVFCESFAKNVIEGLKKECMLFEFDELQSSEMDSLLQRVCKMKGLYAKRDVINEILRKAKGIPEKALYQLEKEIISNSLNKSCIENIETIPGTNRILIIAPHAAPGKINDEYTEVIARTVQSNLNCYAVINEKYSREEIDLNSISEIQKKPQIEAEFLSPIRAYKDEIKGKGLQPLLVFIHGITDENIRDAAGRKAKVLLGYGQGGKIGAIEYPNRQTLSDSESELLPNVLKVFDLHAEKASIGPKYCGHSEDNLNQLFNLKDHIGYFDPDVRSVQLEIKARVLRGNEEQALKTGDQLAKALKKFVEMNSKWAKNEILPSPVMLVRSQVNRSVAEASHDEKLVSETYEYLKGVVQRHFHRAMLEAGTYIVEKFFDGDFKRATNPRNATKIHSLNELIRRLQGNDGHGPSKTWVYNAVKLAVDERQFRGFSVYGKLGLSHKVYLTHVKNLDAKRQLIQEAVENSYTVAQTRSRIAEVQRNGHQEKLSLSELPAGEDLEKIGRDELLRLKQDALTKIEFHKDRLAFYEGRLGSITTALKSIASKRNASPDHSNVIDLGPREATETDRHEGNREQGVI